jgi:hypothetical protein
MESYMESYISYTLFFFYHILEYIWKVKTPYQAKKYICWRKNGGYGILKKISEFLAPVFEKSPL